MCLGTPVASNLHPKNFFDYQQLKAKNGRAAKTTKFQPKCSTFASRVCTAASHQK